jgi:hypothetical protein
MLAERCSTCGSKVVVYIAYGCPSEEIVERFLRGDVVLGGSTIWPEAPDRVCQYAGLELSMVQLDFALEQLPPGPEDRPPTVDLLVSRLFF